MYFYELSGPSGNKPNTPPLDYLHAVHDFIDLADDFAELADLILQLDQAETATSSASAPCLPTWGEAGAGHDPAGAVPTHPSHRRLPVLSAPAQAVQDLGGLPVELFHHLSVSRTALLAALDCLRPVPNPSGSLDPLIGRLLSANASLASAISFILDEDSCSSMGWVVQSGEAD